MIAVGFAIRVAAKADKVKHYGTVLARLGLVFFGMGIIGEAMLPWRDYEPFLDLMVAMEKSILGVAMGLTFTALVNSSASQCGLVWRGGKVHLR